MHRITLLYTYCLGILHLSPCCPLDHPDATMIVPVTTLGARVATSAGRPVQFMSVRRCKALLEESKSACGWGIKRGAKDLAITLS